MSDAEKQSVRVFETYRNLRKFHNDIASLLSSADAIMQQQDWQPTEKNVCHWGESSSMATPQFWLPREYFRFYKLETRPNLLAFVAVLVDDWDYGNDFDEALVSGGCLDYGEGVEISNNWKYWFAHYHLFMNDRVDDGTICSDPMETEAEEVQRAWTVARPLDDIINAASLQALIVEPMINTIAYSRGEL